MELAHRYLEGADLPAHLVGIGPPGQVVDVEV